MMPPIIELRYIHIKWNSDKTVASIEEGHIVPSSEENGNICCFDLYAYTKAGESYNLMQPAFMIKSTMALQPYILRLDGEKVPLREVSNPVTGNKWWIEDGQWASGQAWHGFTSQWLNSAGEVEIAIGNTICRLTLRSASIENWQLIFDEFKNELYHLIFKEGSSVRATVPRSASRRLDERLLKKYLRHIDSILRTPKKRLTEIQSKKNLNKLKPVTKTFMEFVTNPTLTKYTGKDTQESFDTADNRYIHYTLQVVERIVKGMLISQRLEKRLWQQRIDNAQQQLDGLSGYVQVDKNLFLKELAACEEEYKRWNTGLKSAIKGQILADLQRDPREVEIHLEKHNEDFGTWTCADLQRDPQEVEIRQLKYNENYGTWTCNVFKNDKPHLIKGKEYCYLVFESCFNAFIHQRGRYKMHAISKYKNPHDQLPNVCVYSIKEMYPLHLKDKLAKLRRNESELEQNGWHHPLSREQQTAQSEYRVMLKKEQTILGKTLREIDAAHLGMLAVQPKLNNMRYTFSNWCRPASNLPTSMAFVQNPDYYGAHASYSKLRELADLDESTLEAFEQLEQMGVVDIPTVYERWCLLQVIKIVTEVFGFNTKAGWEQSLVRQIVEGVKSGGHKNVRDINLEFDHKETGWKLEVWYEKSLPNVTRPDITLVLTTKNSKDESGRHTLILDAKYYEDWRAITKALEDLYLKKDYGESGQNHVFILHPHGKDMPAEIRVSPQVWGKHNYYGERQMFDWEADKLQRIPHKYGFIRLSPQAKDGNNINNLQRLIGMFLQYPFYLENDKKEVESGKYFCINCGASFYVSSQNTETTKSGKTKYKLPCKCKYYAQLTHCFACGSESPIFKNGPYWSYHKAELLEPYNISCPDCGSFLG